MSDLNATREVLVKARSQMLDEIGRAGSAGGIGRAQNLAALLVNIHTAISVVDELLVPKEQPVNTSGDRMAALRAAKRAKAEAAKADADPEQV